MFAWHTDDIATQISKTFSKCHGANKKAFSFILCAKEPERESEIYKLTISPEQIYNA